MWYLIKDHWNTKNVSVPENKSHELLNKSSLKLEMKHEKQDKVSDLKFITTYNPALFNINKIIRNDSFINPILRIIYLLPYFHLNLTSILFSTISSCNKCDFCKNCLMFHNKFKCISVRESLLCNRPNFVNIISCKSCGDQYLGSAIDFKFTIRIQKSDIKAKKDRRGTAVIIKYFSNCSS